MNLNEVENKEGIYWGINAILNKPEFNSISAIAAVIRTICYPSHCSNNKSINLSDIALTISDFNSNVMLDVSANNKEELNNSVEKLEKIEYVANKLKTKIIEAYNKQQILNKKRKTE